MTVEKVDVPPLPALSHGYVRPSPGAPFIWRPATPGLHNICGPGDILTWRTASSKPGDPPLFYLVFPTVAGQQWNVQQSLSPAGPWLPGMSGSGDGADANALIPAAEPRKFFRVR
jgi:hypothetical protein